MTRQAPCGIKMPIHMFSRNVDSFPFSFYIRCELKANMEMQMILSFVGTIIHTLHQFSGSTLKHFGVRQSTLRFINPNTTSLPIFHQAAEARLIDARTSSMKTDGYQITTLPQATPSATQDVPIGIVL